MIVEVKAQAHLPDSRSPHRLVLSPTRLRGAGRQETASDNGFDFLEDLPVFRVVGFLRIKPRLKANE